jgi:hypothetical protein
MRKLEHFILERSRIVLAHIDMNVKGDGSPPQDGKCTSCSWHLSCSESRGVTFSWIVTPEAAARWEELGDNRTTFHSYTPGGRAGVGEGRVETGWASAVRRWRKYLGDRANAVPAQAEPGPVASGTEMGYISPAEGNGSGIGGDRRVIWGHC